MKILIVNNVLWPEEIASFRKLFEDVARSDTEFEVKSLREPGMPGSTEYLYRKMLYTPKSVEAAKKAEKEGYDGVFLSCFLNPGLYEAREIVNIPVVGAGEISMLLASTLGHDLAVIVPIPKMIPVAQDNARMYGVDAKVVSWRSTNISVQEMLADKDLEKTTKRVVREGKEAVTKDGAEVIVLGCGGMPYRKIGKMIGAPVVQPSVVGFKAAELMVDLYLTTGLTHSKVLAYSPPPEYSQVTTTLLRKVSE